MKYFYQFRNLEVDVLTEIRKRNTYMLSMILGVLSVLFFLLFISSYQLANISAYRYSYLRVSIVSVVFLLVNSSLTRINLKFASVLTRFGFVFIYSLFAWFSSFAVNDTEAVQYFVVIIVLPVLLIENPLYTSVVSIIVTLAFGLMTSIAKTEELSHLDTFNSYIYVPISIFVSFVVQGVAISYIRHTLYVSNERDTDQLTGLYTKTSFQLQVNNLISHQTNNGCMLFFDLDKFKTLNDTYGHVLGDKILVEVGHAISAAFYTPAIKSRFGGDEFVVFIPGAANRRYLQDALDRYYHKLSLIEFDGVDYKVFSSVGISILKDGNKNYDQLLLEADEALYTMKRTGRVVIPLD